MNEAFFFFLFPNAGRDGASYWSITAIDLFGHQIIAIQRNQFFYLELEFFNLELSRDSWVLYVIGIKKDIGKSNRKTIFFL